MTPTLDPTRRLSKRDTSKRITNIETPFDRNELIVSKTDTRGTIIACNDIFAKMSGWSEEELMGSNHNLIRHPDMPQIAFQLCWDIIRDKKEFFGYVKNLRKDGGYYWVFAYITGNWQGSGEITSYTSYRRFAPELAVKTVSPIYKLLLKAEKEGGIIESGEAMNRYLANNGFGSYDNFIVDLQLRANASLNQP